MAPSYKLIYFEVRGAAECARYILKYGNLDFEDIRYKITEWPQLKSTSPFGQLPLLEHNGRTINQSIAISRYLAKQVNLAGNNDFEDLQIDAIVGTVREITSKVAQIRHERDADKRKTLLENCKTEILPFYFSRLEKIIEKNNGHLALNRLTWADFYLASVKLMFEVTVGPDIFTKYSAITSLIDKIENIPAIKSWIETRPKTPF